MTNRERKSKRDSSTNTIHSIEWKWKCYCNIILSSFEFSHQLPRFNVKQCDGNNYMWAHKVTLFSTVLTDAILSYVLSPHLLLHCCFALPLLVASMTMGNAHMNMHNRSPFLRVVIKIIYITSKDIEYFTLSASHLHTHTPLYLALILCCCGWCCWFFSLSST